LREEMGWGMGERDWKRGGMDGRVLVGKFGCSFFGRDVRRKVIDSGLNVCACIHA
jgi:hypothetical protein